MAEQNVNQVFAGSLGWINRRIDRGRGTGGERSEFRSFRECRRFGREEFAAGQPVDWSFAELLAFSSLLLEKTPVRLTGQDSRRGTFSQRHAVLHDVRTGEPYTPLGNFGDGCGNSDSQASRAASG